MKEHIDEMYDLTVDITEELLALKDGNGTTLSAELTEKIARLAELAVEIRMLPSEDDAEAEHDSVSDAAPCVDAESDESAEVAVEESSSPVEEEIPDHALSSESELTETVVEENEPMEESPAEEYAHEDEAVETEEILEEEPDLTPAPSTSYTYDIAVEPSAVPADSFTEDETLTEEPVEAVESTHLEEETAEEEEEPIADEPSSAESDFSTQNAYEVVAEEPNDYEDEAEEEAGENDSQPDLHYSGEPSEEYHSIPETEGEVPLSYDDYESETEPSYHDEPYEDEPPYEAEEPRESWDEYHHSEPVYEPEAEAAPEPVRAPQQEYIPTPRPPRVSVREARNLFSLNDVFFYQRVLFRGSSLRFKDTLQEAVGMYDTTELSNYLEDVHRVNVRSEEAKNFIAILSVIY